MLLPTIGNAIRPVTRTVLTSVSRPAVRLMSSKQQQPATARIAYSAGEDEEQLSRSTALLTSQGGKWRVTDDGRGLERSFRFKSFKATWDFMNTVAAECKVQRHHPEWTNIFNKTEIRWTTHKPLGLSSKDVHMARFCDDAGISHGEVMETAEGSK